MLGTNVIECELNMLSYEYLVIKIEVTIILELFYFETVQSLK